MDKYQHTIDCILSLKKYLDCDILSQNTTNDPKIFTTRYIDLIIHLLDRFGIKDYETHLRHQKNILKITKDCEIVIFNDPKVRYSMRKNFSGKYGTMSNILTSYYFYLYWHLIQKGVEINADEDCKSMFYLLQYIDYQLISATELVYIKHIIQYIKNKINSPFFEKEWWEWFEKELINNIQGLKKHKFYLNQQNDFDRRKTYLNMHISKTIDRLANIKINILKSFLYLPYEYSPNYTLSQLNSKEKLDQLKIVKNLFLQN
jgi:hypothetical protein